LDEVESHPYHRSGAANAWGEPADTVVRTKGHPAGGRYLAGALVEQGFDITWAYRMRHEHGLPHAFINAMLLLDYDRRGLPWPVVPFHVNCYGSSTISKKGAFAHIEGTGDEIPDPPGPTAARCFGVGAAVARALAESPWRVALIASSMLVSFLPDGEKPLSLPRSGIGSHPARGTAGRAIIRVEGFLHRATGGRRPAGTVELGMSRRRDGRARAQTAVGRYGGDLHLRRTEGVRRVQSAPGQHGRMKTIQAMPLRIGITQWWSGFITL
jgi:hypothetical protein